MHINIIFNEKISDLRRTPMKESGNDSEYILCLNQDVILDENF